MSQLSSRSRSRSQTTLAYHLLLATALVWGATFTLVKSALADSSPLLFNLLRFALATLVLAVINRKHLRAITRTHLKAGLIAGLFLAAGYQFQTLGLARTTPAKSAFITGLVVLFVPTLTLIPRFRPTNSARPGPAAAAGALLAFVGLILITTPAHSTLRDIGAGDLLTLACALAFAAHLLILAHIARHIPAGLLATLQIAFCTVFMLLTLPLENIQEHSQATFTPRLILALIVCAVFATAAAFTIQSFAQQVLPPTHAVLILTLEPVFAWLTSLVIFHEVLSRRSLTGAALILAGILIVELLPTQHSPEVRA